MNSKRMAALFNKHLRQELPAYDVHRGIIYRPPLEYLLCGFDFESSAYDKDHVHPTVLVLPLFVPKPYIHYTFGKRLCAVTISPAHEAEVMEEVRRRLVREGLPFIERLHTLPLFARNGARMAQGDAGNIREDIAYATILAGDVERGRRMAADLARSIRRNARDLRDYPWLGEVADRAEAVAAACERSPAHAVELLDRWTAETKAALKLPST
jgi:hypothetical protein